LLRAWPLVQASMADFGVLQNAVVGTSFALCKPA